MLERNKCYRAYNDCGGAKIKYVASYMKQNHYRHRHISSSEFKVHLGMMMHLVTWNLQLVT